MDSQQELQQEIGKFDLWNVFIAVSFLCAVGLRFLSRIYYY
jgi:hypothetical protein